MRKCHKYITMRIFVIIVCHINLWTFHGIDGYNGCQDNVPVIEVCRQNEKHEMTKIFVNTGSVPLNTAVVCKCTIIPAVTREMILYIQIAKNSPTPDYAFTFEINNVTLNDSESLRGVSQVKTYGTTQLVYSSPNESNGAFCLWIMSADSEHKFSMRCVPNHYKTITGATTSSISHSTDTTSSISHSKDTTSSISHSTDTTSSISHSTDTTTELTVSKTRQTQPPNDANSDSETNITLIAIISGSIGGVALIAVVLRSILCCKRKRKPEVTEATAPNEPENNDDYAYGMVTNPSYEHFSEVLPMETIASEDHNTKVDYTNIDSSSHYYSTPIKTDNNKLHNQKIQHDEDDTYDHTASSTSCNWTGNKYKRQQINQNNCDNENYSVLNPK